VLSAFAGGRFLGLRHGAAPAGVVALHGWARTHADFDAVLAGSDAAVPDLPGFGATAAPDGPWGAPEYADALAPLVEQEGRTVIVVGHSFGGRIAVLLAARRPELVSALVLSGVPLCRPPGSRAPKPPRSLQVAKALRRAGLLSADRLEARRQRSGPADYRDATGVMRDVFVRVVNETNDGTYLDALDEVRCPIELVWGENDTAAPVSVARAVADRIPAAKLTVLTGVGHLTPLEAPAELRAAVERCR
jgi:pimeloyl-ACP methyl ester carboxylesterase